MYPIPFRESNVNLGAGDNPNTIDLPSAISTNPQIAGSHDIPFMVSCWRVTEEEIEQIRQSGIIWLSVMGGSVPPVMLMTENPFKVYGYIAKSIDLP